MSAKTKLVNTIITYNERRTLYVRRSDDTKRATRRAQSKHVNENASAHVQRTTPVAIYTTAATYNERSEKYAFGDRQRCALEQVLSMLQVVVLGEFDEIFVSPTKTNVHSKFPLSLHMAEMTL